ncbi:hypothetical protein [Tersicoccus sp. Bi-70]|nr:hypothetical protein [Tersicoccus sp. Bi-70]
MRARWGGAALCGIAAVLSLLVTARRRAGADPAPPTTVEPGVVDVCR